MITTISAFFEKRFSSLGAALMVALAGVVTVYPAYANIAPIADADGPYVIFEGDDLTLDGSGSSDPDGDPLNYSWDVNGDGVFGDAIVESPTLTWAMLQALGLTIGTSNVALRVDDFSDFDTDYTTLTINPVPVPPAVLLLGTALAGMAGYNRYKRRKQSAEAA